MSFIFCLFFYFSLFGQDCKLSDYSTPFFWPRPTTTTLTTTLAATANSTHDELLSGLRPRLYSNFDDDCNFSWPKLRPSHHGQFSSFPLLFSTTSGFLFFFFTLVHSSFSHVFNFPENHREKSTTGRFQCPWQKNAALAPRGPVPFSFRGHVFLFGSRVSFSWVTRFNLGVTRFLISGTKWAPAN